MRMTAPAQPLRLAVLLCTHDGDRFLPAQLASLWAQTRRPDVLFVHDWGSRDGTRAVLQQGLRAAPAGCAVHLELHEDAPGAARSFLAAIGHSLHANVAFDHLLFCDQDDLWAPHKLATIEHTLLQRPSLDLVYSDVALVDADDRLLAASYLGPGGAFGRPMDIAHLSTLFVSTVSGMSMAVSRRFLQRHAGAWSSPDWVMHDWAVTIAACLTRAEVAFVPEALVRYRQHGGNLVGGTGRHRGLRSLSRAWREGSAYVARVQRQYAACARQPSLQGPGCLRLEPGIGRFAVAWTVLRGQSMRLLQTCKVAAGYALFWSARR